MFVSGNHQELHRAKKGRRLAVHAAVLHFDKETSAKWMTLTQQVIQAKPTETAKSVGITYFKAGGGWCDRFLHHEGLSLRHQASICQGIPPQFEEELPYFQRGVIQLRKKQDYMFRNTGSSVDTAVYFDMPRNCTVDVKMQENLKLEAQVVKNST
jgi:hypothetical protein